MGELKTFALKCPGCGAGLKIAESLESFACAYCGASVRVDRGEGVVSLTLLTDVMQKVQVGTDRTAAELAMQRFAGEIADLNAKLEESASNRQLADKRWREIESMPWIRGGEIGLAVFFAVIAAAAFNSSVGVLVGVLVIAGTLGWRHQLRQEGAAARDEVVASCAAKEAPLKKAIDELKAKREEQRKIVEG